MEGEKLRQAKPASLHFGTQQHSSSICSKLLWFLFPSSFFSPLFFPTTQNAIDVENRENIFLLFAAKDI
jgi:hypothetical protein